MVEMDDERYTTGSWALSHALKSSLRSSSYNCLSGMQDYFVEGSHVTRALSRVPHQTQEPCTVLQYAMGIRYCSAHSNTYVFKFSSSFMIRLKITVALFHSLMFLDFSRMLLSETYSWSWIQYMSTSTLLVLDYQVKQQRNRLRCV